MSYSSDTTTILLDAQILILSLFLLTPSLPSNSNWWSIVQLTSFYVHPLHSTFAVINFTKTLIIIRDLDDFTFLQKDSGLLLAFFWVGTHNSIRNEVFFSWVCLLEAGLFLIHPYSSLFEPLFIIGNRTVIFVPHFTPNLSPIKLLKVLLSFWFYHLLLSAHLFSPCADA